MFNGVTIGVAGLLGYAGLLWAICRARMRSLGRHTHEVASYDRASLSLILLLLTLSYAPITETVLSMFNCRQIGNTFYLRNETGYECYTPRHNLYRRIAAFWTFFYVAGVPVLYLALLYYYGIPALARRLQSDALLRSLLLHAHHLGVGQSDSLLTLTCESMSVEHVDALYARYGDGRSASREEKLSVLLLFARERLTTPEVTWRQAEGDALLAPAEEAIGALFAEFHVGAWYWELVEVANKLVITGVLGFIAPGEQAQVVAGLGLTFLMLLAYQRVLPYHEKAYRGIGYAAAIQLFLFFALALMLKAGVRVTQNDDSFFGAAVGVLFCSVFTLPVLIVARRLRWPVEDEEKAKHEPQADEEPQQARCLSVRAGRRGRCVGGGSHCAGCEPRSRALRELVSVPQAMEAARIAHSFRLMMQKRMMKRMKQATARASSWVSARAPPLAALVASLLRARLCCRASTQLRAGSQQRALAA